MIQARPIISSPHSSEIEVNYYNVIDSPIDRILQKISKMELPEREHFESYIRHKWRMNHKISEAVRRHGHQQREVADYP